MKRHVLIVLLAIILFSGCTASNLVRRAKRKDPSLFTAQTSIQVDTMIVEVPKVSEIVRVDTLVEIVQVDPITLIETVIKYKIHNDTIMIDCPDQQIITEVITNTEIVTLEPTLKDKLMGGVYIGLGIIGLFVIGSIINKVFL